MKKQALFLFAIILAYTVKAQDITGNWNGKLRIQGIQLRLVFHISKSASGYTTTMDSPDQGANGIPVTTTTFDSSKLKLQIRNLGADYEGIYRDTVITGTFQQRGVSLPLNLKRGATEKLPARLQELSGPYPYYTEEVSFKNTTANIRLAGTLSLPGKNGYYPAVILITGSGPQNRDEEIAGHKPFLVIADYLTRNGIAVLRFDDRGTGGSTGDFTKATSADFATDVESALAYLKTRKEINKNKIGLIGHSEGGIIAPMIAAKQKDICFIVLLAAPGLPGNELLLLQQEAIAKASGVPEDQIKKTKQINQAVFNMVIHPGNEEKLKADITRYLKESIEKDSAAAIPQGLTKNQFIQLQVNRVTNPWMEYFLRYDPSTVLKKVNCPVLALNGEKDLQVPARQNLDAIKKALESGSNKNSTAKEFPNLNHLFQDCKTGLPAEYATIEETFSPLVLDEIKNWILQTIK